MMTNTTDISKPYREVAELFWEFHRARLDDPSLSEMKPYIQPIVDLIDRAAREAVNKNNRDIINGFDFACDGIVYNASITNEVAPNTTGEGK